MRRDVLGDAEHADHELVRVVPVRLPEVAQPAARAVTGADAILGAGLLAGEQALSAPLHEAQVSRLDQRRPAAQGLDLGGAVADQVGEGAGRPLDDHATVGLDAQIVHDVGGQAGERQMPDLVPPHRVGERLQLADVAQLEQVERAIVAQRRALDLEANAVAPPARRSDRPISRRPRAPSTRRAKSSASVRAATSTSSGWSSSSLADRPISVVAAAFTYTMRGTAPSAPPEATTMIGAPIRSGIRSSACRRV